MLRNRNTGGDFVRQGKRSRFSASASPTLFAFFPGFGLASRIRHSLSPTISWNYSPAASVPEEYRPRAGAAGSAVPTAERCHSDGQLGLSQTFEAKPRTRRPTP